MGIESIIVITKAGLPVASYPEEITPDRTVFSGILAALVESGKKVGVGEVNKVTIGEKTFLVKNFENIFIVVSLDEDVEAGTLFLEALYGSMRKILNFFSFEEGDIDETTSSTLANIIRTYYEAFNTLVNKYRELMDVYRTANKILGAKSFELLQGYLNPFIEVEKINDKVKVKSVNTDDPEVLIERLDSATKKLKRYLASML